MEPPPNTAGEKWEKDEASAKNLLLQKIPDLVALKIHCYTTMAVTWAAIIEEYTRHSIFAQTELCVALLKSKYPEKGDIHKFLDDLQAKREDLQGKPPLLNWGNQDIFISNESNPI
jgi:gag-polypeptide of LTR copia-type